LTGKVVVTGGAGYLGSHCAAELLALGYEVLIIDNFSNSSSNVISKIERCANKAPEVEEVDICDLSGLQKVMHRFSPDYVIHFAALKSVSDSIQSPDEYYRINVGGSANLLSVMGMIDCQVLIFSSSATVYGTPQYLPCDENHPINPLNPYGRTKYIVEQMIEEWVRANLLQSRQAICLRYFNPVGAHSSGFLGESPLSDPSNLMPVISEVAAGLRDSVAIFGIDYPTSDGTGERDYVHVMDLVDAHIKALEGRCMLSKFEVLNIGTGRSTSVRELISLYELVAGRTISSITAPRRDGDAASCWADVSKAERLLGLKCRRSLRQMCEDDFRWRRNQGLAL
jgi:UDP-glucose 4-epimerase